jgi:DNA-binding NtrC family response regulator
VKTQDGRSKPGRRLLIVDDDAALSEALASLLAHKGFLVSLAQNSDRALEIVGGEMIALALVDVVLGQDNGLDLLPKLKAMRPEMSVILITAAGSIEMAVECMNLGADNFVEKPLDPPRLLAVIEKGLESWSLRRRSRQLDRIVAPRPPAQFGESLPMKEVLRLVQAVAGRDTTVLLQGETGSGKGMLARRIHEASPRRREQFIELNCAGLNRDLTESELFGHERGAFTGAVEKKGGLFEAADGGTLFLDEIGEMEMSIQAKLLKVLEERRFRRVGGVSEIEVDVRLIAASHRDLEVEAAQGRFRRDLLYRLNVFSIRIPPLRERRDDILPLALRFLSEFRTWPDLNRALTPEAAELLCDYAWPGNVRELRNVMERAAILCPPGSRISAAYFPPLERVTERAPEAARPQESPAGVGAAPTFKDAERQAIEQALGAHGGNIQAAARALGISRGTIYRKAKKYGIPLSDDASPDDESPLGE